MAKSSKSNRATYRVTEAGIIISVGKEVVATVKSERGLAQWATKNGMEVTEAKTAT